MPDSAPLPSAKLMPKVEELRVTTGSFPASRKAHMRGRLHPEISVAPGIKTHEIIRDVETRFKSHGSLYKVSPLAEGTQALLMGTIPGQASEPVAWVNRRGPARVFYTSLGHPDEVTVALRCRIGITRKGGDHALLVVADLPCSCGLLLRLRVGEMDEIAAHQPARRATVTGAGR